MVKFPIKGSADQMLQAEGIDTSNFDCAGCTIPDGTSPEPTPTPTPPPNPPPDDDGTEPSGVVTEIAGCMNQDT